jgi:hypothetical protein
MVNIDIVQRIYVELKDEINSRENIKLPRKTVLLVGCKKNLKY